MVPVLAVPLTFLSQGIKIHQISYHRKFWSISWLHPRNGIPWILVHIWWRSFLSSSFVLLLFKTCTQAWQPNTCKCDILGLTVKLVFYSQLFLSVWHYIYTWTLTFTACIKKPSESPAWCHMDSVPLTMVCWNLSTCPFCCGKSGIDISCSIQFSRTVFVHLKGILHPDLLMCISIWCQFVFQPKLGKLWMQWTPHLYSWNRT